MLPMYQWLRWGAENATRGIYVAACPYGEREMGVSPQGGHPSLDRPLEKAVVCIQEGNELSLTLPQPGVACRGGALIRLVVVAESGVASSHLLAVVDRSVVHDNRLDSLVSLSEHTLHRLVQEMRLVPTRNYDRDERFLHY
jgi:hypothetical protein